MCICRNASLQFPRRHEARIAHAAHAKETSDKQEQDDFETVAGDWKG